jgi:protein-disulfide isomerase
VGSVVAVLGVVFLLIWFNRPGSSAGTGDFKPVERARVAGRQWGDPAAPVRIIAFEDFQCPFCARYTHDVEAALGSEFIATGKVSYEFHHMAFLGEESTLAAQASECAVEQNQFWPYHDVLFLRQGRENSGVYTIGRLKDYGREVDAALPAAAWDQAAFESCVYSGRTKITVERLTAQAREVGVTSTPTLLVNGQLLRGVQSIEQLRQAIAAAQSSTR